jgi:hypothetical protein
MNTFKAILTWTVIVVSVGALSLSLFYFVGSASCKSVGTETLTVTKYDFFGGCFVRTSTRYVPIKSWRVYE